MWLALVVPLFVTPSHRLGVGEPRLEGVYSLEGTEPGGGPEPSGTATIERKGPNVFTITEISVDGKLMSISHCLYIYRDLVCGWGGARASISISIFHTTLPETTRLDYPSIRTVRGRSSPTTRVGEYATVESSDGHDETGTLRINWLTVPRANWFMPSGVKSGYGIREPNYTAFGLVNLTGCGVAIYHIADHGRLLTGRWLDPARAYLGYGTETLKRM